ncbi:MAG: lysozyme, partial [Candidatus Gastranaerophilaceae bacterium]
TKEQAEKYFREDVAIHENNVSRLVKVPLTQNQFDALVSFEYNVGYGNFANSTLLRLLNAKKYTEAAEQFSRWVYTTVSVNGKPKSVALSGLVNRRKREKEIFLHGF